MFLRNVVTNDGAPAFHDAAVSGAVAAVPPTEIALVVPVSGVALAYVVEAAATRCPSRTFRPNSVFGAPVRNSVPV